MVGDFKMYGKRNMAHGVLEISSELRDRLMEKGASLVGYADLSSVPQQIREGYRYGIAIGVALRPQIIRRLKTGPDMQYYYEYNRINTLLNELAECAAAILRKNSYEASPKTQSVVVTAEKTWSTVLPHKTVATRAGMGWIGKCALLVTKEYGSALRICSVLTNAELDTGEPVYKSMCGDCTRCRDACPGKAVSGKRWIVGMQRDEFYKAHDCRKAAREMAAKAGIDLTLCGMCIYVCPWTQKYINSI